VYQALFGDRFRLALDREASRAITGREAPLVHPLLAAHMAIGQTTWASQRVKANLFYRGLAMQRPVHLGDTLHTVTEVVALRQNRVQPGRAATGVVGLEMRTRNQRGEIVLHFWRCPMIPCRNPEAVTGHVDDLDAVGRAAEPFTVPASLTAGWRLAGVTADWSGTRAADVSPGTRFRIEARDTITMAPELVRLTLNLAMAHTDARLSYVGERLVYGGHVFSIAFAQLQRALPNLLAMVSWESCEHVAPVVENDRIRTEATVVDVHPAPVGTLLRVHAESWAARGAPETETKVLDWRFSVLSA